MFVETSKMRSSVPLSDELANTLPDALDGGGRNMMRRGRGVGIGCVVTAAGPT